MFYNIFYGLLLFAGGILILKYRKNVYEWTGWWGWAEHYLWRGGTVTALCLIACCMMGFWVAAMFGKVNFWNKPTYGTPTTQANNVSNSSTNQ